MFELTSSDRPSPTLKCYHNLVLYWAKYPYLVVLYYWAFHPINSEPCEVSLTF